MWGVESDVTAVEPSEIRCAPKCVPPVYLPPVAALCRLLFGVIPPGLDSERQIPNIGIWEDGVELESITPTGGQIEEYSFTIVEEEDEDSAPKQADIIFYGGKFFVIGEVHTVENPYLEIEPETIWVYPDWAVDNDVYSNTQWNVK